MACREWWLGGCGVVVIHAEAAVKHVVLVGRFHERVQARILAVDVQFGSARSQIREAKATKHSVHRPVAHVGCIAEVVAEVELFHPEQSLRWVGTCAHGDPMQACISPGILVVVLFVFRTGS